MNQDFYCVIMAGGAGTRFWPISRSAHPKQFLDILGLGKTLLQQTFDRFSKICPSENIFIVTSAEYKEITLKQLPDINESQVLLEPARRNTAPCIAYANFRIQKINPKAKIIVAPSDHLIINEDVFINTIKTGLDFVTQKQSLLTLGIEPTRPDTGYGYIQINKKEPSVFGESLRPVKTFTEKPDIDMARFFVESGEFYWNSGIFIWSLEAIQESFKTLLPEVYNIFNEEIDQFGTPTEQDAINKIYPTCTNISIDYGIMEKAPNVFVLGAQFGWSDLGTWTSLFEHMDKDDNNNAIKGENIMLYDVKDTIINSEDDKLVVIQGLDNHIVVNTSDALLICNKNEEQQLRLFVNDIKSKKGDDYI